MSKRIPQAAIDEILQRCDLVELINEHLPLKKKGSVYLACCPFHQEKTPSFNVIPKHQFYHCFGCKANGNAIDFLIKHLNYDFITAVNTLAIRIGLALPKTEPSETKNNINSMYQSLEKANQFYQQSLRITDNPAVKYLKKRGISGIIAKRFQLGYASNRWSDISLKQFRNRVIFPIHNTRGQVIGFGGRVLQAEHTPKYLNSPETPIFQKKRELYGLYQIISENKHPESIIVVEGYLDVITLAQFGITNAVAVLGTSLTNYHLQLLHKYTNKIYICFDGDNAGKTAQERALEITLASAPETLNVCFINLPEKHDPDSVLSEFGIDYWYKLLEDSKNLTQFCIDHIKNNLDTNLANNKQQALTRAQKLLKNTPESIRKTMIIDEIAKLVHLEPRRVQHLIDTELNTSQELKTPLLDNNTFNLIDRATSMLLKNPSLASAESHTLQSTLSYFKIEHPFRLLSELVLRNPAYHAAQILEHFRDTQLYQEFSRLLTIEQPLLKNNIQNEWLDLLFFIQKQRLEKKIQKYIEKSKNQSLTLTDKTELQKLIRAKIKNNFSEL